MNVVLVAIKENVQIVRWLLIKVVVVGTLIEKYNVGRQESWKINLSVIKYAKREKVVGCISVTHSVVSLETRHLLRITNVKILAKKC